MLVKEWFNLNVTDDIADSIGIGKYFVDIMYPQTEIVDWEAE